MEKCENARGNVILNTASELSEQTKAKKSEETEEAKTRGSRKGAERKQKQTKDKEESKQEQKTKENKAIRGSRSWSETLLRSPDVIGV